MNGFKSIKRRGVEWLERVNKNYNRATRHHNHCCIDSALCHYDTAKCRISRPRLQEHATLYAVYLVYTDKPLTEIHNVIQYLAAHQYKINLIV